ncbi:MAG: F0F1 ATP synthase subunit gamma, partial [Acidocella sp. 20-61-6]
MPSLKSLRIRINSVKSTQKITSAMKMVAAAKLRRSQSQAEAARPYARRMGQMMSAIAAGAASNPNAPELLVGTGKDKVHLLVAVTADRGLAGAFNSNIGRAVRTKVRELQAQGKVVKILAVGRKGNDYFRREMNDLILGHKNFVGKKTIEFTDAEAIADNIVKMFREGQFDICT